MGAFGTTLGDYLDLFDFHLHPYGMHLIAEGLSHGLNKCPLDTCLHQCAHWCRPFESLPARSAK